MKRLSVWVLFVLSFALGFASCSDMSSEYLDPEDYANQDIDYQPSSFYEARTWVAKNITYKKACLGNDKQTPEETYKLRTGDCDDYAILLAYFGYKLGLDVKIIAVWLDNRDCGHAIVYYNGHYVEPQISYCYWTDLNEPYHIVFTYTYHDAFYNYFYQ